MVVNPGIGFIISVRSGKPSLTRGHDERLAGSKKVSHTDNLLKDIQLEESIGELDI